MGDEEWCLHLFLHNCKTILRQPKCPLLPWRKALDCFASCCQQLALNYPWNCGLWNDHSNHFFQHQYTMFCHSWFERKKQNRTVNLSTFQWPVENLCEHFLEHHLHLSVHPCIHKQLCLLWLAALWTNQTPFLVFLWCKLLDIVVALQIEADISVSRLLQNKTLDNCSHTWGDVIIICQNSQISHIGVCFCGVRVKPIQANVWIVIWLFLFTCLTIFWNH